MIDLISGPKLKLLLKKRGISQRDVSNNFNIAEAQISRYFRGVNEMPAKFIFRLMEFADLDLKDILVGDNNPRTIDTTHIEVAAEPHTPYIVSPPSPPTEQVTTQYNKLISIDTSKVETFLMELSTKLSQVEREVSELKKELQLVNH